MMAGALATELQGDISSIMREIETSQTLRGITAPKTTGATRRIARQARFWVPVILIGGLAVLGDWLAANFRHLNTGVITYVTQVVIFLLVATLFYWMLQLLQTGRGRRKQAQAELELQTEGLASARATLIERTTKELGVAVTELETLTPGLPATNQGTGLITEGTNRLRQIITTFGLLIEAEAAQTVAGQTTVVATRGTMTGLDGVLGSVARDVRAKASAKDIRLVLPTASKLAVMASTKQLRQVISTTLANAIEFSAKGSTVVVGLTRVGSGVTLTVRDHGQGISADQLDHLFKPFSRSDGLEAITLNHEGLGLNLYIDKLIMDEVGGSIDVQSVLGRGTTVSLSWPQATATETTKAPVGLGAKVYGQDYHS
jgi:signal transduction histidine kinase